MMLPLSPPAPVAPPFQKIVIGEIKEAVQHPDADRLRVCKVDVGQGDLLNIVCGAPNARVGIKVPCATVGAELPPGEDGKPFKIKVGKLRGVESQGMLCSADELGLPVTLGARGALLHSAANSMLIPSFNAGKVVETAALWPVSRITAAESVWGEGFVAPGGAEEVARLMLYLASDASSYSTGACFAADGGILAALP